MLDQPLIGDVGVDLGAEPIDIDPLSLHQRLVAIRRLDTRPIVIEERAEVQDILGIGDAGLTQIVDQTLGIADISGDDLVLNALKRPRRLLQGFAIDVDPDELQRMPLQHRTSTGADDHFVDTL